MKIKGKPYSEEEVLIETYWNVNVGAIIFTSRSASINRNILECKLVYDRVEFASLFMY